MSAPARPVVAAGVAAGALALVVLLVVAWAGHERAEGAPRSVVALSFDAVESTISAGGLIVCSSRPVADPSGAGAVEARVIEVGSTCAPDAVARVTVTRYADVDARDAAARSVEGLLRPRGGAVLYTAGDLVLLVDGGSEDGPRERLGEVLSAAGAR